METKPDKLDYTGKTVENESFAGKDIRMSKFIDAKVINCDFSKANLTRASFKGATLINCNFNYAKVTRMNLEGSKREKTTFLRCVDKKTMIV